MKYRIILIGLLSIIFTFQSCNKVEESYLIETGEIQAKKTILIEEFTGHQCPNCPRAAKALDDIVDTYGDRIVIVAIHANYNGRQLQLFLPTIVLKLETHLTQNLKWKNQGYLKVW